MIVLRADMHKSSHTIAAVDAATGQVLGEKTVAVGARGLGALVLCLAGERACALEDCRHVPRGLGRFLIGHDELVLGLHPNRSRPRGARTASAPAETSVPSQ
jgi:hypothetical protein